MDGSNGKITGLLERIAHDIEGMREGQEAMRQGQEAIREDLHALRGEMHRGFDQVGSRLDHMVTFLGSYHADHEQRIQALEARVLKSR